MSFLGRKFIINNTFLKSRPKISLVAFLALNDVIFDAATKCKQDNDYRLNILKHVTLKWKGAAKPLYLRIWLQSAR